MLLASSGFITICPKKEVELGADRHLHRADHAEELRKEISFDCPKATGNQYAYLPGGAVRAINPNSSMTLAETENMIAVFKGNLFNKADLALQVLGCPASTPEAQLLLRLYDAKGLDMLGMLKGQYAFCLYDSKQARVLAARDHSGAVPLMEGRTAAGSLIIACGTFLPEGVTQMVDIQPGEYKYGWHALPRAFRCGETRIVAGRASCDYGIRRRSIDAYNAPPARRSMDLARHSSLDIQRQHSGSHHAAPTSHSYSHTPGRYMPPQAHAAASGAGFSIRSRATSLDGARAHHYNGHQGGLPSPCPAANGRRRSETNTAAHTPKQQHTPAAEQHWIPKSPAGSAAVAIPQRIQTPVDGQLIDADEVTTPGSASTLSTQGSIDAPHRRRRRHHRRGRGHSAAATAAAGRSAADGHESEADSQVSSSTHDSVNSGPSAKQQTKPVPSTDGAASNSTGKQNQHARAAGAGGFKRNGSCSELAVMGSSPSSHAQSILVAAPQALAC